MAGLYAPLPTLRRRPRGRLRTDRGRRGLLLLHRSGLSPHPPCQSPGALTRVAACTLARSPIVTANRRLQPFRYLHDCSDCFRLERIAGWASHPLESAAFSRRTPIAAVRCPIIVSKQPYLPIAAWPAHRVNQIGPYQIQAEFAVSTVAVRNRRKPDRQFLDPAPSRTAR